MKVEVTTVESEMTKEAESRGMERKEKRNKVINEAGHGHEQEDAEWRSGRDERRRKFKKKIVISGCGIEEKGEFKAGQLRDRMKGKGRK